jgi:hypothetical protein
MFVQNNSTKSNSVYLIIDRFLSKRDQIAGFIIKSRLEKKIYKRVKDEDILTSEN